MPGLDVLRGVAILSVFFFHGLKWSLPQADRIEPNVFKVGQAFSFGWLGVNLFFVLSGFLITGILLDTRTRENYWRSFYVRRVLRILPLYLAVLVIIKATIGVSWLYILMCLFYLANFAYLLPAGSLYYAPLWSLAVEEQFYLLWPLVVRKFRKRTLAGLCVAGIVISPVLRALSISKMVPLGDVYFTTWLVCDNLLYGALLAIFLRTAAATARRVRMLTMTTGLLAVVFAVAGFGLHMMSRNTAAGAAFQPEPFLLLFIFLLLLALQYGDRPVIYSTLAPLRFFGYISYGLYMFHLLGFRAFDEVMKRMHIHLGTLTLWFLLFRFVVVWAGLTLWCYLSRRYFEEYFLRFKDRLVPYETQTAKRTTGALIS
jgi:peptidoglycan/LPS O-acetylase OafA/YrhL